jgi:hypothetical protein
MTTTAPGWDEWCLIELMGHRRVAARVREVTLAGAGMLRLDEPATDSEPGRTQYVAPASVYALHPTTEEVVTAMAARWRTAPVQRWELPAMAAGPDPGWQEQHPGDLDDEDDEYPSP